MTTIARPIYYGRNPNDGLWYPKEQLQEREAKAELLRMLPEETRKVFSKLGPALKLSTAGNILYPDSNVEGSSLVEMSRWLEKKGDKPLDADKFMKLLRTYRVHLPENWINLYS